MDAKEQSPDSELKKFIKTCKNGDKISKNENFENCKLQKNINFKNTTFKNFVVWALIVIDFWSIVAKLYYNRMQKMETPDSEL